MLFFLILPAWLLCVLFGATLLCFRDFRRTGIYAITISTAATAVSLLLSTAVLYFGPRTGLQRLGWWSGVALVGAYLLTATVGALLGALTALFLTRKLLPCHD
jgi:hypothetical protein